MLARKGEEYIRTVRGIGGGRDLNGREWTGRREPNSTVTTGDGLHNALSNNALPPRYQMDFLPLSDDQGRKVNTSRHRADASWADWRNCKLRNDIMKEA